MIKKIELVLVVTGLILAGLVEFYPDYLRIPTIVILTSLAIFYRVCSFNILFDIGIKESLKLNLGRGYNKAQLLGLKKYEYVLGTLFSLTLTVFIIGVLFNLLKYPGSKVMVLVAMISAGVIFVMNLILLLRSNTELYRRSLYRIVIVFIVSVLMHFVQ